MKRILSILFLSLILSACASVPVELNRSSFDTHKIEAILLVDSDAKIQYQRSDSGAASGAAGAGLIGALVGGAIDSGVNSKRSKSLAPVIDAMADYNPNLYLKNALANEAKGVAFQSPVNVIASGQSVAKLTPRVIPSYTMAPDFGNVSVSLSVSVEQHSSEEKDYVGIYSETKFNDISGSNEENRQNWIDNPEKLIAKLQSAISEAVQRFVADFNGDVYIASEPAEGKYPTHVLPIKQVVIEDGSQVEEVQLGESLPVSSSYPALVNKINSPDTMTMRAAATKVGKDKLYADEGLMAACISVLEKNLISGVGKRDKYLIDGLSWCALNLGNAGSAKSEPVLTRIKASDLPRKLRSHAIHALKQINGDR